MKYFYNLKRNKGEISVPVIIVLIGLLFLIFDLIYGIVCLTHQEFYTYTITDKNVKYDNDTSKYLIYGTINDGETLVIQNTDEFWYGKFNSSDIYSELKIGSTYKIKVIGFRVPFFSQYQNLIEYELIE